MNSFRYLILILLILVVNLDVNLIMADDDKKIVIIAPDIPELPPTECDSRDDCIAFGFIEPTDFCDPINGDVVRPHLSCFKGICSILTGTPNDDSPYRIDCNYGKCYTKDDGVPMCCTKDNCIGGGEIPVIGIGDLPPLVGPIIDECDSRDDCIALGFVEPADYCDALNGDVVRPHLSCFMDKCQVLTGTPNNDGPYRVDCNYAGCYVKDDGIPMCCTKDGCSPKGVDPGIGIGVIIGIGDMPIIEGPGIVLPGECKIRDDCLGLGFVELVDYCDILNGDVVRPHLSCFKEKCTILTGTPNDDGSYRVDCNYGGCYLKDDGTPMCCTKDGCPDEPVDDKVKIEKDKIDDEIKDKAGILPGDFFFFIDLIFDFFKDKEKIKEERAAEVAVLSKNGKTQIAKEHLQKYFVNKEISIKKQDNNNVIIALEKAYESNLDKNILKSVIDKEKENSLNEMDIFEELIQECSSIGVCCLNSIGCKNIYYDNLNCLDEQVCCDVCNIDVSKPIVNNNLVEKNIPKEDIKVEINLKPEIVTNSNPIPDSNIPINSQIVINNSTNVNFESDPQNMISTNV